MNRRSMLSASGAFLLAGTGHPLHASQKTATGPVIVEAGRRVDAPDTTSPRFPPQNVKRVRKEIELWLSGQKPTATVSSAACGTDLLMLAVADEMHIPSYILLPTQPEEFRASSVEDRPGDWGTLYTEALRTSKVEVLSLPEGQAGYLETNIRLLDRAQTIAGQQRTHVKALVVWNKESRGPDDVTAHFLQQARLRKLEVVEILTA